MRHGLFDEIMFCYDKQQEYGFSASALFWLVARGS